MLQLPPAVGPTGSAWAGGDLERCGWGGRDYTLVTRLRGVRR